MERNDPILETPRLLLRDFREDDESKVVELFAEPAARPYILRYQRSRERMSSYVQLSAKYAAEVPGSARTNLSLAVALRDGEELIGVCSLSNAVEGSRSARIGWHIGSGHSGRGYATEVGRELIRFAFEERNVERVYADCYESNAANVRVLVKLGMRPSPALAVLKWLIALAYLEPRPIVRYATAAPARSSPAMSGA